MRNAIFLNLIRPLILLSLSALNSFSWATELTESTDPSAQRPQIGLVLSGGGAKGAAHIGVLKVLEELNVNIDYIAGTSMGAVVGGLYATGLSAADIEREIERIDWDNIFEDDPERRGRSMWRKQEDLTYLAKIKPRVRDGAVNIAPALIQGQKLGLELRKLTLSAAAVENFDALPIPFRAVATDAMTGQAVVLGTGDLALAIRASMAVPMVFAPVEIDGQVLIDGGVASNTPISVVREMGADIVITVLLDSEPLTADQLNSPLVMVTQLVNLLTTPGIETELATITPEDIVIRVDLRGIDVSEFGKMGETIPRGRAAAEAQREVLQALSLPNVPPPALAHLPIKPPIIQFIRIKNNARINDALIRARLQQKIGEPLDFAKLENSISDIYSLDLFSNVDYQVLEEAGQHGLLIRAEEKAWGTDYIQAGLELSADLDGDAFFNLGVAFTRQPFNELDAKWSTTAALGEQPEFSTELYQPLDPADRWFTGAAARWESNRIKFFENDTALTEYEAQRYGVNLFIGRNVGDWGSIRLGLDRFTGRAKRIIGVTTTLPPEIDFHVGELTLEFSLDSVDSVSFPRHGQIGLLSMTWSRDFFGADQDFEQVGAAFLNVASLGNHSLLMGLGYQGSLQDDIPLQSRYTLGGFLNLSGLQANELTGEHVLLGRVGYQYRYGTALVPIYLGVSLESGNAWEDSVEWDGLASSLGLYLGADTLIGPVYLGYGIHDNQDQTVYLFLGQPWL